LRAKYLGCLLGFVGVIISVVGFGIDFENAGSWSNPVGWAMETIGVILIVFAWQTYSSKTKRKEG
jgi:hypothetical protein